MTKPTFQEVRKRHGITLNMLIEDTQVDPAAVLLLESLSRLCGTEYRRDLLNVGGFTFAVQPPDARVAGEVAGKNQ